MSIKQIEGGGKPHRGKWFLIILFSLLVIAACFGAVQYAKQITKPLPFEKYITDNPRFVFKTTTFRKYLAQGTRPDINAKLYRLQVYQVKATAKYFIEMNNISVDEENTDIDKRNLHLIYTSNTYFPVSVDIDMSQSDIIPIKTVTPQAVSEAEATNIASSVSEIAGGLGALVGIKLGSDVGGLFGKTKIAGKLIGGSIGGLVAGLGTKYEVFTFSKNYFSGRILSNGYSLTQQEEFLVDAKQIMGAEMLDMNIADNEAKAKLRKTYEEEIHKQVEKVAKKLKWESVDIKFVY